MYRLMNNRQDSMQYPQEQIVSKNFPLRIDSMPNMFKHSQFKRLESIRALNTGDLIRTNTGGMAGASIINSPKRIESSVGSVRTPGF